MEAAGKDYPPSFFLFLFYTFHFKSDTHSGSGKFIENMCLEFFKGISFISQFFICVFLQ